MNCKEKVARVIRVLSVPPIMISALVLILAFCRNGIFRNITDIIILITLLGFVPILAYVLQFFIPKYKNQGREGQRKLAFITNLIGYTAAFIWAIIADVDEAVLLICSTYFFSVVLLTICNKGFHFRASGHASSFTGPLVLLIYFLNWKVIVPCMLVAALIIWSSLFLKRHTAKELTGGIVVCLLSFGLSLIMNTFI